MSSFRQHEPLDSRAIVPTAREPRIKNYYDNLYCHMIFSSLAGHVHGLCKCCFHNDHSDRREYFNGTCYKIFDRRKGSAYNCYTNWERKVCNINRWLGMSNFFLDQI